MKWNEKYAIESDITGEAKLIEIIRELAADVAERLQKHGLSGSTIGVKIKRADFTITGRQMSLAEPTADAESIVDAAIHGLHRAELNGAPVRLIGVRVAGLTMEPQRQMRLV